MARVEHFRPAPVFNLTVEGSHEFFANGILTHNCDQMRYVTRWVDAHFAALNDDYTPEPPEPLLPSAYGSIA